MILLHQGIRRNLIFMVVLAVLPVVALASGLAVFIIRSDAIRTQQHILEGSLLDIATEMELRLREARSDVLFLSRVPDVRTILYNGALGIDDSKETAFDRHAMEHLKGLWGSLLESRSIYEQVRCLDLTGIERFRMKLVDGKALAVPPEELQNKGDLDCFKEAARLLPGETYESPVDLDREQGRIVLPPVPSLRIAASVRGSHGELLGLVIIDIAANPLLHASQGRYNDLSPAAFSFITDGQGYYLHHSKDLAKEWGAPDKLNTGEGLKKDFPDHYKDILQGGARMISSDSEILVLSRITHPWRHQGRLLVLGHVVPAWVVMKDAYRAGGLLVLVSVLVIIVAGLGATFYGRKIVAPLSSLSEKMAAFREGDREVRAEIAAHDEIGSLAAGFNEMAEGLARQHERLEEQVADRTKELRESQQAALNLMQAANIQRERLESALQQLGESENALKKRIAWAVSIHKAGEAIAAAGTTIRQVVDAAVRSAVEHLGVQAAWVCAREPDGQVRLLTTDDERVVKMVDECECPKEVFRTGQPLIIPDVLDEPPFPSCTAHANREGFCSCATFPIKVKTDCMATYTIHSNDCGSHGLLVQAASLLEMYCRKLGLVWQRCLSDEELRKLSRAVEQSQISIIVTNTRGIIEYVNPKFTAISGYKADEVLGRNPSILQSGHTSPEEYAQLWKTIKSGNEWRGEFLNKKKSGELYWEAAAISPVRNEEGVITHFVAVKEDITELKQAYKELQETKLAAEQANRAKSEFLAGMSHELRTPLNAIIGFSEILSDQIFGTLNEKQARQVQHVLNGGRHLLSLINDILDLSKVESGKMELEVSPVNISALLNSCLSLIKERALKHGLKLQLAVAEELDGRTLPVDERKMKQIIFNLLSNAVKFTPDRGEIAVKASVKGRELEISVADTGIGIAEKDQQRVFEEFVQVDSSYGRTQQGTGLGLALTRKLVELHGGRIRVESEGEGRGSIFTFTIPFSLEERQEKQ